MAKLDTADRKINSIERDQTRQRRIGRDSQNYQAAQEPLRKRCHPRRSSPTISDLPRRYSDQYRSVAGSRRVQVDYNHHVVHK